MENTQVKASNLNVGYIGWKYYNSIRKKAMEQEFSWSGFAVSLSIAFFVILASALILGGVYNSVDKAKNREKALNQKIYQLENFDEYSLDNYLHIEYIGLERMEMAKREQIV